MVCKSRLTRRHRRIFFLSFFSSLLQRDVFVHRCSGIVSLFLAKGCWAMFYANRITKRIMITDTKTQTHGKTKDSQPVSQHQNINRHCCEWEFILHHRHLRCTPIAHLNGIENVCSFPCHRKAAKIIFFFIFATIFYSCLWA